MGYLLLRHQAQQLADLQSRSLKAGLVPFDGQNFDYFDLLEQDILREGAEQSNRLLALVIVLIMRRLERGHEASSAFGLLAEVFLSCEFSDIIALPPAANESCH